MLAVGLSKLKWILNQWQATFNIMYIDKKRQ